MGVYASSVIDVSIPAANVPALAQALRAWDAVDKFGPNIPPDITNEELVGTLLVEAEGTEETPEYTFEPGESLDITGSYYGKISWDCEAVEDIYSKHGAVGYIDVEAEGEMWRVRFTKDGRILRIPADVTYPGDEE